MNSLELSQRSFSRQAEDTSFTNQNQQQVNQFNQMPSVQMNQNPAQQQFQPSIPQPKPLLGQYQHPSQISSQRLPQSQGQQMPPQGQQMPPQGQQMPPQGQQMPPQGQQMPPQAHVKTPQPQFPSQSQFQPSGQQKMVIKKISV